MASEGKRKYYGFHIKTKSWEELPDAREVMIAGRKIIISRPWENSDSWTATEPETGASVLTFFEETPEAAISVAELACCISEERWQKAIANAKAYPGWYPCPYSRGG